MKIKLKIPTRTHPEHTPNTPEHTQNTQEHTPNTPCTQLNTNGDASCGRGNFIGQGPPEAYVKRRVR